MKVHELNLICRVCLTEASDLVYIFNPQNDVSPLLMACAAIEVLKNDGLPSQVCKSCVERATMSFEFKKLCEESDFKLREYILNNVEIKQEKLASDEDNVDTFNVEWLPNLPNKSTYKKKSKRPRKVNDEKYACTICNSVYYNEFDLKVHHASHRTFKINGRRNTCPFCQEYNKKRCRFLYHMGTHMKYSQFKCVQCSCYFTSNFYLKKHIRNRHKSDSIDNNNLNDDHHHNSINDYFETETVKIELENCVVDVKNEPNSYSNTEAISENPMKEEEPMETCKTSIELSQIGTGKQIIKQKNYKQNKICAKYQCDKCQRKFIRKASLIEHLKRHLVRIFLCSICGSSYSTKAYLDTHILKHSKNDESHECPICGTTLKSLKFLKNHLTSHRNNEKKSLIPETVTPTEKPYSCSICKKSWISKSGLASHMTYVHSNKPKHKCEVCEKEYAKKALLKIHLRTHTGEKPYECKWCHKRFGRTGLLRNHVRRHMGEKPYPCRVCGKGFALRCDAQSHEKRNICQKQLDNKEFNKYDHQSHSKLFIPGIKTSEEYELLQSAFTKL